MGFYLLALTSTALSCKARKEPEKTPAPALPADRLPPPQEEKKDRPTTLPVPMNSEPVRLLTLPPIVDRP